MEQNPEIIIQDGLLDYSEALELQRKLTSQGRVGWLLFTPPPTITLGIRAKEDQIRADRKTLEKHGIQVLKVDRGGLATFHGPGQIVGFPFGTLKQHTGDTRAAKIFVDKLKVKLKEFMRNYSAKTDILDDGVGLWTIDQPTQTKQKVVSIGLKFSRESIGHGFAMNVDPESDSIQTGFSTIVACGDDCSEPGFLIGRDQFYSDKSMSSVVSHLAEVLSS